MSGERILVVDSNRGFAMMLKQSLEQEGAYEAVVETEGAAALDAVKESPFDLAIVDLGIEEPAGVDLARGLRHRQPDLRLMLIPFNGDELSQEVHELDIQGVLPKPFFLPELPDLIADALSKDVGDALSVTEAEPEVDAQDPKEGAEEEEAPVAVEPARVAAVCSDDPAVRDVMTTLGNDVKAEAVIITCGEELLAHIGRLQDEKMNELALAVSENLRTSERVAKILGQEQLRFEQSVEGGEYVFYSLAVTEDVILSVALGSSVSLGMIRHQAKEAAVQIQNLLG